MPTNTTSVNDALGGTFMCGVCEGFYGKPWSQDQRRELFSRMQRMKMNTYLYAPKDDYKHRLHWRQLYNKEEAAELTSLIKLAEEHGVNFVYALSPGLDITFSSKNDVNSLKQKLDQVKSFGCRNFALLFDDIDNDLCNEDVDKYQSPADAQSSLSNDIYNHLDKPTKFLFCPTEYCTSRAVPDIPRSEYLKKIGDTLDKGIDILWTGPKVVSRLILSESIKDVIKCIQRPPVIWDNLHANDYDQTRLFLGPYDGRPRELLHCLKGVLTNPNCEFEANFIAMHTLAQWRFDKIQNFPPQDTKDASDVEMEDDSAGELTKYEPTRALLRAVEDWIPEFYKSVDAAGKLLANDSLTEDSGKEVPPIRVAKECQEDKMDTSDESSSSKNVTETKKHYGESVSSDSKPKKKLLDELEPLDAEEVLLLCDLFYLPYEYGPRAVHLLKRAHWLISNVVRLEGVPKPVQSDASEDVKDWYKKAVHFHECHKDLTLMVDKFVNIPNRDLLHQLYSYVSDVRNVLSLVNSYIKWHGMGKLDNEPFRSGEQEPWVHRGGLHSELRRLLPLEGKIDMFPTVAHHPPPQKIYTIRPYFTSDKDDVFAICRKTCDDGLDGSDIFKDHPDMVADESIGAMLEFYPNFAFVLEDDVGICGYSIAAPNIKEYMVKLKDSYIPKMQKKYPKLMKNINNVKTAIVEEIMESFHRDPQTISDDLYEKYPSLIRVCVLHGRMEGMGTPKELLACGMKCLKENGSSGAFTTTYFTHFRTLAFLYKLGFDDRTQDKSSAEDMTALLVKPT